MFYLVKTESNGGNSWGNGEQEAVIALRFAAAGITNAGEELPQNNSATQNCQAISIIRRRKTEH